MTPRILLVGPTAPWRHRGGIGLRSSPVFEALSRVGETDVCVLSTTSSTAVPRPGVHSFFIEDPLPRRGRFAFVRALLGQQPTQISGSERLELPPAIRGRYDLVWVFGERLHHLTAGLGAADHARDPSPDPGRRRAHRRPCRPLDR